MAISVNILGETVQLSGNPVYIECSGASAPAGSSEYKVMLRVISEDGKLLGAPFEDAITPSTSGEALFNISAYVDQPVKAQFQYPASGIYVAYPTQAFNVQVQAGERYIDTNGDLQETWGAVSAVIQMLKGGFNPRQIAIMNDASTSFYKMYIQGGNWLTARPDGDQVHPTQEVKLWYMVDADKTGVVFNVRTVYDDETEDNYASAAFAMGKDNLYEFNCNPILHGVDIEPTGKKAEFFQVWLSGGETSDVKGFYFDWRPCERPIFLFFANSLGGVDDVFFSGYIKDRFATEGKVSEFPTQNTDTVFDPTLVPTGKTGQNKWTFNTGWKPLTTMQYFRDLMLARQAWYKYSNLVFSYHLIPILIDSGEKTILDRQNNMFNMNIGVSEAHRSAFVFDNRSF